MNDLTLQMQHETCQFATQLHTHTQVDFYSFL